MKRRMSLFLVVVMVLGIMTLFAGCGPKVESIELAESSLELKPGESVLVNYTISPAKASGAEVTWSSSDESVATINSDGHIVAKSEGTCEITITAGKQSDSIDITVILTPEMLMAEGKYLEAYQKAESDDEKKKVYAENVIAYLSNESSEGMKDPSSFVLRDGYYKAWTNSENGNFGQQVVLHIAGSNSYGATVSSYWVWVYDQTEDEWDYWGSETSTEIEDDDDFDVMLVKIVLENVMRTGVEIDKSQVKNINAQFEADTLYEVELMPLDELDKSLFPTE